MGDLGSIPGLGRSPGEGKGYPLQYSGLENSMDCMGLQRVRHDFHFHFTVKFTFNVQLRTEFKFQCIFYIVKYSPMILLDF